MRRRWGGSRGFTLPELLVALAIVGMVLAAVTVLLEQGHKVYRAGAAKGEAQQSARVAVERLARELRAAGVNPTGARFSALLNPTPTGFTIQNDLNGDGVIRGNRETITYSLTGHTLRRNAGGGAQPLIEGVESLTLTYLDGAGNAVETPDEVRAVVIAITVGGVSMTTQVRLRNR
ncbi:MAG: prepilin-type N-terminal cleavage/methylation domain-containing protein [Candidatus Rokubacteria bacterium]|nr:prepilin-type N-terminal cleavage/methylation domain-containing protein [Candidatus Rokubacteria bacterium]